MRGLLIAGLSIAAILASLWVPPIRQDPAYHSFADRRSFFGVANFLDVASSAPFGVIGAAGLALALTGRAARSLAAWERWAFGVLFGGLALTALGSAYYHLAPDDARLFWDRLPMALVFMSLCAIIAGDRTGARAGQWLLAPLLASGAASVVYWRETGDLRFYALVQFFPMLALPLMLLLFPPRRIRTPDLWAVFGWYALAKAFELLDAPIFALGGIVSGHSLKHLAVGAAAWRLFRIAGDRRLRPVS
jgi:hypothetical protein